VTTVKSGAAEVAAVTEDEHPATAQRTVQQPGPAVLEALPGDIYGYELMLPPEDQEVLLRLREWLQREVAPIASGPAPSSRTTWCRCSATSGSSGSATTGRGVRRRAGC